MDRTKRCFIFISFFLVILNTLRFFNYKSIKKSWQFCPNENWNQKTKTGQPVSICNFASRTRRSSARRRTLPLTSHRLVKPKSIRNRKKLEIDKKPKKLEIDKNQKKNETKYYLWNCYNSTLIVLWKYNAVLKSVCFISFCHCEFLLQLKFAKSEK